MLSQIIEENRVIICSNLIIHNQAIIPTKVEHKKWIKRIREYTDARKANGDYKWVAIQRHTSPEKAELNDFTGKYGEFVANKFLADKGFPNISPDTTFIPRKKKSFDADLQYTKLDPLFPMCHVKSCGDNTLSCHKKRNCKSLYSWTFHNGDEEKNIKADPLVIDPDRTDLIAFTFVPDNIEKSAKAILYATTPWNKVHGYLLPPLNPNKTKICIYSNDLVNNANLWCA